MLRIPLDQKQFTLLQRRQAALQASINACTEVQRMAKVAEASAQEVAQAFQDCLFFFAPEGSDLGALNQIALLNDKEGMALGLPDPLPKADPGGV